MTAARQRLRLIIRCNTVSDTIRRVERACGQKLFRRSSNGMLPTDAALTLVEAFRAAENLLLNAGRKVVAARSEARLVVSASPSIASLWLISGLSRLADALPEVSVEVRTSRDFTSLDAAGRSRAILVFADPESADASLVDRLRTLFSLSPAESAIAVELGRGRSVAEITFDRGVRPNTLNAQLKSIMAKMGCSRQAEVAAVVAALPLVRTD